MLEELEKGTPEGQENVVFVNTALIWRAMEQVQRSQADFRALLEQAQVDPAVAYDVGLRYAQGDGVDADLKEAAQTEVYRHLRECALAEGIATPEDLPGLPPSIPPERSLP